MNTAKRIADWLEIHWVAPAYSGWLLSALSLFFFVSATNTLAGWLYVMSGISFALLAIAAILPERMLRGLQIQRSPIAPVTVGDPLGIELVLTNTTAHAKMLLQIQDQVPFATAIEATAAIERIAPQSSYRHIYHQVVSKRGLYRWRTVSLRTAAPLGLFWCRRSQTVPAIAVVYPTVLPLTQCPLVDDIGRNTIQVSRDRRAQAANEGLTRSLRPYRWGDPIRLVHWRTSARYGALRVRELETLVSDQALIICLDSASFWQPASGGLAAIEPFEQAVVAAASLYFYATRRNLSVTLWTAGTGLIQGNQAVLETLAAVQSGEDVCTDLPNAPLLWLTQNPVGLSTLLPGSRWLLWAKEPSQSAVLSSPGILVQPDQPLQLQLQGALEKRLEGEGERGRGASSAGSQVERRL